MAKTLQHSDSSEDPGRIMAYLVDHLANYAQYFVVEQRGSSVIQLTVREVVARQWQFQRPGFRIKVSPRSPGCRIALQRTLAPLANWFLGILTAGSALALAYALALIAAHPSEGRQQSGFVATAAGLTFVGMALRQVYYFVEGGRDRELTGILQKALADFGRPTAIRRREESRGPGTGR